MNLKITQSSSIATAIRSRAGRLALLAILAFGPTAARATVYTWSGAGSNHGWVQQANYVGGTTGTYTFTNADTIYFSSASASYFQPVFGSNGTVGTLEFGAETGTNPITITRSNSAVLTVASGILVDAGAGGNTITTALTLSGSTATFTNNSSNILVVSVPTGSNQLSINGGVFHFQAAQAGTFTGSTTVNTGATLRVLYTTTLAGSVDVKSGGTLGGRGTIGATTIESGATLAPGVPTVPVSSISFSSSLSLGAGSLTLLDLTNSAFDSVNVVGSLAYGGELRLTLADDFATAGNYALFGFSPGSESGNFSLFNVYNSTGKIGELSQNPLNLDVWSGEVNGLSYNFDQSTGTLAVVPEPGTAGLAVVGLLAAIVLRARIHRKSSLPPAASTGTR